jgi:hypothetical protein
MTVTTILALLTVAVDVALLYVVLQVRRRLREGWWE